jgi:ABC-type amino acid transport substrate-binding protein
MSGRRFLAVAALALAGVVALAGCAPIPRDPDGTLDRVTGGELRVGASPAEGLVEIADGTVSGPLVDIVEGFAEQHDARAVWTIGSEEDLVFDIEQGSLDMAIGGMTDKTPWAVAVGVTRGYPELDPGTAPVVMFVPLGENGFLSALEGYLDHEAVTAGGAG